MYGSQSSHIAGRFIKERGAGVRIIGWRGKKGGLFPTIY